MLDNEARSMKSNIVLSGIKEHKGENCNEVAKEFFKKMLIVEKTIKIRSAYRVGKGEDRDLRV